MFTHFANKKTFLRRLYRVTKSTRYYNANISKKRPRKVGNFRTQRDPGAAKNFRIMNARAHAIQRVNVPLRCIAVNRGKYVDINIYRYTRRSRSKSPVLHVYMHMYISAA